MMSLTKDDLKKISDMIDAKIDLRIEPRLTALEERIDFLPTKDEFYTMMDKLLGVMNRIEQENEFWKARILNHEDRLRTVEDALEL